MAERRRRLDGPGSPELGSALGFLGNVYRARGRAAQLYEEAVSILTPLPAKRTMLAACLRNYAGILRQQGEAERAGELELRAAELDR